MAVRFLPPRDEPAPVSGGERADLAEVIDLRSRLPRVVAPSTESALGEACAPQQAAAGVPEAAEQVQDAPPPRSANEDAVRLLARKALSSGELRRELRKLGHGGEETEAVVDEFTASLYLDDSGLARLLVEGLRERKRASRAQLRAKLRERLLPDTVIEEILGELDDDAEFELLRAAAQDRARRLGDLDRQTAERRLLGYLARRGWSGEPAVRACREALDAAGRPAAPGVSFR